MLMLARKHKYRGDSDIHFDEPSHKYTVRGRRVPISVTALCAQAVPAEHRFDGYKIIRKNLTTWRSNASNKHNALVKDVSDAQAIKNVLCSWNANRDLGTSMHKCFEQFLNDEAVEKESEFTAEMQQFHVAMDTLTGMKPVRTEMSIFANDAHGDAAVAGQIDLLMQDTEGGLHIIDFKRTAGDLDPGAFSFGKTFLNDLPINDHYKYSLQLALYSIIFEMQTGVPILSARLMQVHPDLENALVVPTTDMAEYARELLKSAGVEL